MENAEKTDKTQDFQEKAKKFGDGVNKLKEELNLDFTIQMDFPEFRILPEEVQLALLVLNKHKMQYVFVFKDMGVKDGNNKS